MVGGRDAFRRIRNTQVIVTCIERNAVACKNIACRYCGREGTVPVEENDVRASLSADAVGLKLPGIHSRQYARRF